jgi:hypothetical protein
VPVALRRNIPVSLAISPDGRYLAMAKDTPEIHLWDVLAGREIAQFTGHEGGVGSLLFSRDGKQLFSGGTDTTVLTWGLTVLTRTKGPRVSRLAGATLETLWNDLSSKDAVKAFSAIRRLGTCPEQAVSLIQQRIRPATPADNQRLAKLVADLDSGRLEERQQAQLGLQDLGELAEPALRRALADGPPLGLRQRLLRLLAHLEKAPCEEGLRQLRAVEVLVLIGSPAARQVLEVLAGGAPGARLTREAKTASQRLARQAIRP